MQDTKKGSKSKKTKTGWSAHADPMKARFSYHWYPKHHSAIYAEKFAEEVEKATDVEIDTFDSGQLYGIREAISAVSSGSVEMAGVLDLILGRSVNEFSLTACSRFFGIIMKV